MLLNFHEGSTLTSTFDGACFSWFKKDDNCLPAVYILQPISSCFAGIKSADDDEQGAAWRSWTEVNEQLQSLLVRGARKHLKSPEAVHNYQVWLMKML